MLRRAFPGLARASKRAWKTDSAVSAHFSPSAAEVKADPALSRRADESAKEQKQFKFINYRPQDYKQLDKLRLWRQLIRMDRPVGTRLLFIPCLWGAGLAVSKCMVFHAADWAVLMAPIIPVSTLMLLYFGAFNLRSAGCVINDMWDRELDRLVERTKDRPLASGKLSMQDATIILVTHLTAGAMVLVPMSPMAIQMSLMAVPLVVLYPLMKRFTFFPQLFLGLTMNWGLWVGYAQITNSIDLAVVLPMYLASICWTMVYDTIYAYQDRPDDIKAGIKSTAVYFGESKWWLYAMMTPIFPLGVLSGIAAGFNVFYFTGLSMACVKLIFLIDDVNLRDPWSCRNGFLRNVHFGFYIFAAMAAANFLWIFFYEQEQLPGTLNTTTPALAEYLLGRVRINALAEGKSEYDPTDFSIADRLLKPAYVYATVQERMGKSPEEITIPAWARREYTVQNIVAVARFVGPLFVSEDSLNAFEKKMYDWSDHYNIVSLASL